MPGEGPGCTTHLCCHAVKAMGQNSLVCHFSLRAFKGRWPLYNNPFGIVDTLHLTLLTSWGEVLCYGCWLHYQLLGAINDSCIDVGDQCFYPHPSYENVRLTKAHRYYSSQTIPYSWVDCHQVFSKGLSMPQTLTNTQPYPVKATTPTQLKKQIPNMKKSTQ